MPREPQEPLGKLKLSRGKNTKTVRICPVCKKPTLRMADSISGWMTADIFSCSSCGYRGGLYIEVDVAEFERSQREDSRKQKNKERGKE